MPAEKFETSISEGKHAQLSRFTGEWEGVAKTWFKPGDPEDTSPIKGKISTMLGGRFIMHEYDGSLMGKPFTGIMILGYHLESSSWKSAWIDSTHTGTELMFSKSIDPSDHFSVTGSWMAGDEIWGWRTEIDQPADDQLIFNMYIIKPDGAEAIGVKIEYTRRK